MADIKRPKSIIDQGVDAAKSAIENPKKTLDTVAQKAAQPWKDIMGGNDKAVTQHAGGDMTTAQAQKKLLNQQGKTDEANQVDDTALTKGEKDAQDKMKTNYLDDDSHSASDKAKRVAEDTAIAGAEGAVALGAKNALTKGGKGAEGAEGAGAAGASKKLGALGSLAEGFRQQSGIGNTLDTNSPYLDKSNSSANNQNPTEDKSSDDAAESNAAGAVSQQSNAVSSKTSAQPTSSQATQTTSKETNGSDQKTNDNSSSLTNDQIQASRDYQRNTEARWSDPEFQQQDEEPAEAPTPSQPSQPANTARIGTVNYPTNTSSDSPNVTNQSKNPSNNQFIRMQKPKGLGSTF